MAYFANGSEGEILDDQCSDCPIADDAPCPILLMQYEFNYEQYKNGNEPMQRVMNVLIDENGICQMKPILDAQFGKLKDGRTSKGPPEWLET